MNQALQYYSLVLDILCMTYFLTSITLPDPQTSDMHQKRYMMSALPVASARLSELWILCLNDLLNRLFCINSPL